MKIKHLVSITGFLLTSITLPLYAADFKKADLMQAYYQALKSDPTFKRAGADWESAKENLPIARAAYLTQVAVTGNWQRQYNNAAPQLSIPNANGYNYNYGLVLTVSQPIFNLPAWDAIRSAAASVKAATATYLSASQDLMVRTVRAYVVVLQAYDQLRFQLARKRSVYEQLKVAREQFKVGLIAVTGVYDARAVYDQAVAQSIADQNTLNNAVEALAEITGIHYLHLYGIGKQVPLVVPQPNNINTWTDVAERQNYGLTAQNYTVLSTRETLKQQSTSWLPQLSFAGQYTSNNTTALHTGPSTIPGIPSTIPGIKVNNVLYGLSLNFPIIQGGLVTASTRQAEYNYLSASSQREFTYRSVISNTRQSFLGIITGISKIKADRQSIVSARNALNATKVGYEVGTRTIVDVLDDVTSLYQTQQQYTDDQYQYIIDTIELKFNAGTLNVSDLQTINHWLQRNITLNLPEAALKSLKSRLRPIRPFPPVPYASHRRPERRMALITAHHLGKQRPQYASTHSKNVSTVKPVSGMASLLDLPAPAAETATHSKPVKRTLFKQTPEKKFDIPLPRQTRVYYSKQEIAPPRSTSARKLTEKRVVVTVLTPKKKAIQRRVMSSDEHVIPLYEGPKANMRLLPSPS